MVNTHLYFHPHAAHIRLMQLVALTERYGIAPAACNRDGCGPSGGVGSRESGGGRGVCVNGEDFLSGQADWRIMSHAVVVVVLFLCVGDMSNVPENIRVRNGMA